MSTVIPPDSHYTPSGYGSQVTFKTTDSPPPGDLYVRREDIGIVNSLNSVAGVTIAIRGRVLLPDGRVTPFIHDHVPNTNRTVKTTTFPIPEGFLLNICAFASGGLPLLGQTYVSIGLGFGAGVPFTYHQVLIQGFVTVNLSLSSPWDNFTQPIIGARFRRSITGTQPAAGVEITETVPTGAIWRLISFAPALTTGVAAGNRRPNLLIDDGANVFFRSATPDQVAPSLTVNFIWAEDASIPSLITQGNTPAFIANEMFLQAGYRIRTVTTGIAAADQWSAPIYLVEEQLAL